MTEEHQEYASKRQTDDVSTEDTTPNELDESGRRWGWLALSGLTVPLVLVFLSVFFVVDWLFEIPSQIRIGAADPETSVYWPFAEDLGDALKRRRVARDARPVRTTGSIENAERLSEQQLELGLIQNGALGNGEGAPSASPSPGVEIGRDILLLAPVFPEVVHVLVWSGAADEPHERPLAQTDAARFAANPDAAPATVDRLRQLLLRDQALLYKGRDRYSGMQRSADAVLRHYGIESEQLVEPDDSAVKDVEDAFWDCKHGPEVALITTSTTNRQLRKVLKTGHYEFLSLDDEALSRRYPYFRPHVISRAEYGYSPDGRAIPQRTIKTVATTAFLAVRRDTSKRFIHAVLGTLYEEGLRTRQPDLIAREQAKDHLHMPFHPDALGYFNPYDFGPLASMVETLSGSKELMFAIGAGVYLLWTLRRRRRERLREAEISDQITRLDQFLDQTIALEANLIEHTELAELKEILDSVTRLKLEALDELTDKDLRGDRRFSIFLMQCANLIDKIQLKIIANSSDAQSKPAVLDSPGS